MGQVGRASKGQWEEAEGGEERRQVMPVYRRGRTWWYSFIYAGKRVQESAKTTRKNASRGSGTSTTA
jgi:hypothetical protein